MTESRSNSRSEANLPPPSEFWQASATIVGIAAWAFEFFVAVPFALRWDPLGSSAMVLSSWVAPHLETVLLVGLCSVFVLYLAESITNRAYSQLRWQQKLLPWIVFFGVMCPLVPAVTATNVALEMLATKAIGYLFLLFLCAPLVPLFNWICAYHVLVRGRRVSPPLLFMNGVSLMLSAACGVLLAAHQFLNGSQIYAATMFGATIAACALAVAVDPAAKTDGKRDFKAQAAGAGGLIASFCLFVFPQLSYEFHSTMIDCAANSESPGAKRAAVRILRAFASSDEILRTAYSANTNMISLIDKYRGDLSDEAQRVYYWCYGKSYNDVTPPLDVAIRHYLNGDKDLAGEEVGAHSTGVQLAVSQIEAYTDAPVENAMQFNWTMEFRNSADKPQEARMIVAMPKDGVVSRAVLWVNGMPREAIVTSVGQARQAYQNVVLNKKRDPLLVSWESPDRIMVQCFPVPPASQHQNIRIDLRIDAPVVPTAEAQGKIWLPWIVEKNFAAAADEQAVCTVHQQGGASKRIKIGEGGSVLTFGLPKRAVTSARLVAPDRLEVVIDGSAKLDKYRGAIVDALSQIRGIKKCSVHFASDEVSTLTGDSNNLDSATAALRVAPFVGGPDNGELLNQALSDAAGSQHGAVLWIHGPQPFSHRGGMVVSDAPLYEIALGGGPDEATKQLPAFMVHMIPVADASAREDMTRAVHEICSMRPQFVLSKPCNGSIEALQRTLSRSWEDLSFNDSVAIAAGIVSPVTSAVALESREQEEENGLATFGKTIGLPSPSSGVYGNEGTYAGGYAAGADGFGGAAQVSGRMVQPQLQNKEPIHWRNSPVKAKISSYRRPLHAIDEKKTSSLREVATPKPMRALPAAPARNVMMALTAIATFIMVALVAVIVIGLRNQWYRKPLAATVLVVAAGALLLVCSRIGELVNAVRALV